MVCVWLQSLAEDRKLKINFVQAWAHGARSNVKSMKEVSDTMQCSTSRLALTPALINTHRQADLEYPYQANLTDNQKSTWNPGPKLGLHYPQARIGVKAWIESIQAEAGI